MANEVGMKAARLSGQAAGQVSDGREWKRAHDERKYTTMHATKRPGHTLTLIGAPAFEDRQPQPDATIWRISLSPARAFKLLCDIGHLYPTHEQRPRAGAMLEMDGTWTLFLWPKVDPDSQLVLTMCQYGAVRLADASRWHGQAWVSGDLLFKILATAAQRDYWDLSVEPRLLRDARPGWLLALPRVLP